jgi:hypothetical protein
VKSLKEEHMLVTKEFLSMPKNLARDRDPLESVVHSFPKK